MDTPPPPKPPLFRRILAKNFIALKGLPLTVKFLTVLGYLVILGLLLFTLVVELFGQHMLTVQYTLVQGDVKEPLVVMAVTGLAFILGWAYLLTGAATARARIFLPVLALFAAQLFLASGGSLLPLLLEVFFFLSVLVIYGFTFRMRFWHDLPGLHFFGWLAAVTLFVLLSVGTVATNAEVASALSANFGLVMLLTMAFWVLLGLTVTELGIKFGQTVTRLGRRLLPFPAFSALVVFVLLAHPAFAALIYQLAQDGFLLLDLAVSLILVIAALGIWITRRWSFTPAAVLLTLSLASPVLMFGVSLAFSGKDFTSFLLEVTGIFPPLLLFVGLTTFNLFGMGVTFTGVDGRVLPRRARVLLYFGILLLVVACMLFQSNERSVVTGQVGGIQVLANSLFALSALGLGIPYLIWLAWKRQEELIGAEEEFAQAPRWRWLERMPKQAWLVIGVLMACACSCLLVVILFWLLQR